MKLLKKILNKIGRCKFSKECKWYDKKSVVCNRDGGIYYRGENYAGCYRTNERNKKT